MAVHRRTGRGNSSSRERRLQLVIIFLASWICLLARYTLSILTPSVLQNKGDVFSFQPPTRKNKDDSTISKSSQSAFGRRVIYQCTCTGESKHWGNKYWNEDLGRAKQWRRALHRINQLLPDIQTVELMLQTNSDVSCEDLVLNDMKQFGHPEAFEIILSPWYNDGPCKRSNSLDLARLNMSEYLEYEWQDKSPAHLARPRGIVREIKEWGEVFDGKKNRCDPNNLSQLHLSHSKHIMPHQRLSCNIVHVPEQVDWATMIVEHRKLNESVADLLTRRLTREEAISALQAKTEFVGLITHSTWKDVYVIDSLVRHALCHLLTEQYKPCEKSVQWRGDVKRLEKRLNVTPVFKHDTVPLYSRYKFAIALNNVFAEGYMTEKEINPFLAQSIAIVGAPDYHKMANAKRAIQCTVPQEILDDAQRWVRGNSFMPFNTTPDDWNKDPSIQPIPYDINNDADLMKFAQDKFREALQPCISEIIQLDTDNSAYISKLMEPYILKYEKSLFDGTYVAAGLLRWLLVMGSPVIIGLESHLEHVGIDDQTLG